MSVEEVEMGARNIPRTEVGLKDSSQVDVPTDQAGRRNSRPSLIPDEMDIKGDAESGAPSPNGLEWKNNNNSTNAMEIDDSKNNDKNKLGNFLRSSAFKLYIGHFLSSWGDRMWTFAVAVFLIGLAPDSLRLPAIYGLSIGASGLLFKALVGDWVDRTSRMKTVVVALVIQNVSVAVCAGFVILLLLLGSTEDAAKSEEGEGVVAVAGEEEEEKEKGEVMRAWWWMILCEAIIIIIACVANLASSAMKISIQKDWIVVVSGNADDLARMNSVIRAIDLLAKIMAPIATGLIMSGAGHVIGAAFIAAWNLTSLFAEFAILRNVYRDNPALKIKAGIASSMERTDETKGAQSKTAEEGEKSEIERKEEKGKEEEPESGFRDRGKGEGEKGEAFLKRSASLSNHDDDDDDNNNDDDVPDETGSEVIPTKGISGEAGNSSTNAEDSVDVVAGGGGVVVVSDVRKHEKEEEEEENRTDDDRLPIHDESSAGVTAASVVVYEPPTPRGSATASPAAASDVAAASASAAVVTPSIEKTRKTSVLASSTRAFKTLAGGWSTYMRHRVRDAGLGLAFLYMTVLGFDSITIAYAYSQGLCDAWLGGLQATGAVMGMLGTLSFPTFRRRVGLERTGLFASALQISCLGLCLVSIFLPGSPFVLLHPELPPAEMTTVAPSAGHNATSTALQNRSDSPAAMADSSQSVDIFVDSLSKNLCVNNPYGSYVSIGVMMAGIISARFGLWNLDLTITQIIQEQVGESERGIVNGVQHSLQDLLDMIKFILVIFIPDPKHFAYLVILSFIFVTAGGAFYATYTTRARGHFFHFELLRSRSKRSPPETNGICGDGSGKTKRIQDPDAQMASAPTQNGVVKLGQGLNGGQKVDRISEFKTDPTA